MTVRIGEVETTVDAQSSRSRPTRRAVPSPGPAAAAASRALNERLRRDALRTRAEDADDWYVSTAPVFKVDGTRAQASWAATSSAWRSRRRPRGCAPASCAS